MPVWYEKLPPAFCFIKSAFVWCKKLPPATFDEILFLFGVKSLLRQVVFMKSASVWYENLPRLFFLDESVSFWCEKLPPAAFCHQI